MLRYIKWQILSYSEVLTWIRIFSFFSLSVFYRCFCNFSAKLHSTIFTFPYQQFQYIKDWEPQLFWSCSTANDLWNATLCPMEAESRLLYFWLLAFDFVDIVFPEMSDSTIIGFLDLLNGLRFTDCNQPDFLCPFVVCGRLRNLRQDVLNLRIYHLFLCLQYHR